MTPFRITDRYPDPPEGSSPVSVPSPPVPAKEWWGHRRLRYNIGLVLAGLLAYAVQVAVVFWGISIGSIPPNSDPDPMFSVALDGVGYLVMMGIANVCYFLGSWSEQLPFSVPVGLTYFCSTHPSWRQFHG